MELTFVVEQAGCASCAERVRSAVSALTTVQSVEIDESSDTASVRAATGPAEDDVNAALAAASDGSGHAYRVRPGSWRVGSA